MAANEISLTIKLDEDDWKAIERLSMTIGKRLERLEAILDARGLDWDHPRVADEPPKKWRILEPGEVVQEGDLMNSKLNPPSDPPNGGWLAATSFCFGKEASFYSHVYFARAVADEPAKEAEPAWEPKVGDWVLVTMPEDWKLLKDPAWVASMHKYDGKVMQVVRYEQRYGAWVANFCGIDWFFKRDWLSPAEPPEPPKPPEPQYREPVLPADAGKLCEFSDDDKTWRSGYLKGFDYDEHRHQGAGWRRNQNCSSDRARHRFARIKKES